MASAREVVEWYYDAFDNKKDGWRDLVAEEIAFAGPLQKASGKEEFVALTDQFLQFHRETRLLNRVAEGDQVCSLYEFVVDSPAGQPLTCSVTEWAKVSDGRIAEFRIYYDPREFARAFGLEG